MIATIVMRTLLGSHEGAGQCLLAGMIEIGIRLVEHDEARIAEERARETDPLTLAARERASIHADDGLVALRELRDHFVHVGQFGRVEDILVRQVVAHPGNIGLDAAGNS